MTFSFYQEQKPAWGSIAPSAIIIKTTIRSLIVSRSGRSVNKEAVTRSRTSRAQHGDAGAADPSVTSDQEECHPCLKRVTTLKQLDEPRFWMLPYAALPDAAIMKRR